MAELILSDEEKAAVSWLDISDDALGKLCRKACLVIMKKEKSDTDPTEGKPVMAASAGMLLCGVADDMNATTATFQFDGLTNGEKERGNWRVSVEKLDSENVPDELPPPSAPNTSLAAHGG
jgi:hypothetical protein